MVIADLVDTLSRIGAIGGILSIIGVGMLILLVASQSRQIRSMREWIEEEPQRQQETAQRVIAEVQRRIAAARDRRAAATAGPETPVPSRPLPAAPGTLGATPEAQKVAASKEVVPPADGSVPPPVVAGAPAFAPLTPAGGAESAEGAVLAPGEPTEEPAVVSEFLNQETQAADALPELEPLGAPAAAAAPADMRFGDEHFDLEDDEPRGGSRVLFGVGLAALLAGIVLAFFLLFNGGDDEKTTASPPAATSETENSGGDAKASTPAATVEPSSVSVRVLNGTQISGLAQRVTDTLKAKGYGTDSPGTLSSDQTIQNTAVSYREGQKTAATQVAKDLGLSADAVQAINADLSVAAGETADVVVLTGTDLDSTASSTTGE